MQIQSGGGGGVLYPLENYKRLKALSEIPVWIPLKQFASPGWSIWPLVKYSDKKKVHVQIQSGVG